ncbi:unnamed protein product [Ostreobium quekettii]|uniref:Uncharacterized protein n=1 Tax=Ostreobium quekettii TaxID=121088 RepID=A0A8S1INU7_9CHLO|nr:unnamed protein product [Ostreobium quekettii]|eukprot:evm.model.scf_884EXC.1 EVM.evm.TU.scf_884EXC.1   scf_884EXC:8886-10313(+)
MSEEAPAGMADDGTPDAGFLRRPLFDSATLAAVVIAVGLLAVVAIKLMAGGRAKAPRPKKAAKLRNSGGSMFVKEEGVTVRRSARVRAMSPYGTPKNAGGEEVAARGPGGTLRVPLRARGDVELLAAGGCVPGRASALTRTSGRTET